MSNCFSSGLGYVEIDGVRHFEIPHVFEALEDGQGVRFMLQPTLDQRVTHMILERPPDSPDTKQQKRKVWYAEYTARWDGASQDFRDHIVTLYSLGKPFAFRYNDYMSRECSVLYQEDDQNLRYYTPTWPIRPRGWEEGDSQDWSCSVYVNGEQFQDGDYTVYPETGLIVFDDPLTDNDVVSLSYEWRATVIMAEPPSVQAISPDNYDVSLRLTQVYDSGVDVGFHSDNSWCMICGCDEVGDGNSGRRGVEFLFANSTSSPVSPIYGKDTNGCEIGHPPPFSTDWDECPKGLYATRRKLLTSSSGDTAGIAVKEGPPDLAPGHDQDMAFLQFVSDPLKEQSIGGTGWAVTCYAQIRDDLSLNGDPPCIGEGRTACLIKVVSNDGSVVRGTLLDITTGPTILPQGVFESRVFANAAPLTEVMVQDGDRLVVELGVHRIGGATPRCEPLIGNDFTIKIRHGSSAAGGKLSANETDQSNDRIPWLRFTKPITIQ